MKILYADETDNDLVIILKKKENDALAKIVGDFLTKTKPNKQSVAYKLAVALDNRLLA